MPERWWLRLLLRLLPARLKGEVFEPALHDLHHAHVAGETGRGRFALLVLLLFLDCWRLALLHPRELFDAVPSFRPSKSAESAVMFFYYLRHAFVRLRREPAFTVAAVLTLALGVGANVAVFAVVEAVLLRPLPFEQAQNLAILHHRDTRTGITKEFIAIGDYVDIVQRQTAFESVAAYGTFQSTVYSDEEPYQVSGLGAGPGLFDVLKVRPLAGRALNADDSREGAAPVVMVSYDLWQRRFAGDPALVGRSIRMGALTRTVVGITPPGFRFPANGDTDVILPLGVPDMAPAARKNGWLFAVARMKPAVTPEAATANLAAISLQLEREYPRSNEATTYYALSIRDALVGNTKPALVLLLAAVAVVLLIACANVANLQLARSLGRRREIAVRMALGAGRGRLATLLLTESLALALVASSAGIVIANFGARALVALVPESASVSGLADVRLNGMVLGFAVAITMATALIFGMIAALTVRLERAADVLVSAGRASMSALVRRATTGLVVTEVAMAIVLLVGAGLILRSFAGLLSVDPGFRYDNVLTMSVQIPADRYNSVDARAAFWSGAFESIRAVPGVKDVGAGVVVPLTGNNWTVPFERAEQPVPAGERPPDVGWQLASGGFFQALGIPLVDGRVFDERDRAGSQPVVMVSEAIQKTYFNGQSAVGKQVRLGNQTAEIVGVVGNIRRAGLRDEPRADMYFPFETNPGNQITLFVSTAGDPAQSLSTLRSTLRGLESNLSFLETQTLNEVASESVRVTELMLWLLTVFAGTALLLAAVGIYGVMSYVVRQRTREIGTRMAVGATRGDILWLVMRQGAMVAAMGISAGLLIALAATRSLQSILFGVSAGDPLTLGIAATVLAGVTMTACYIPARRASAVDPARTLAQQ